MPGAPVLATLAEDPPVNEFLNHPDLYVTLQFMIRCLVDLRSFVI